MQKKNPSAAFNCPVFHGEVLEEIILEDRESIQRYFLSLAAEVGRSLKTNKFRLATAESCTGGQVAQVITSISKSSEWFERGFVTYSNDAKIDLLGVKATTLAQYGAVSAETAREMAEGALRHSRADISLSVTGIAGPEGGSPEKPVGLVWFAWAGKDFSTVSEFRNFVGERIAVRDAATRFVLQRLNGILKQ